MSASIDGAWSADRLPPETTLACAFDAIGRSAYLFPPAFSLPPAPMAISAPTLRTIQAAQRALLAPLRRESVDTWLRDVVGRVQSVMGADHAYAVLPDAGAVRVGASDVDAGFCDGLRDSIAGVKDGAFLFDDPMPLQMHLHRRRGGSGVYHELEMFDRPAIEASPLFRELFFPFGLRYVVGLSVPLSKGEAMICVGFESPDADGYDPAALRRLELLVPAFESAVRQHQRLTRTRAQFAEVVDRIPTPVAVLDADGREEYCNRALRRLLAAEPESAALLAAVRAHADRAELDDDGDPVAEEPLQLAGGVYHLRLGRAPASVGPGWLVLVDRASPYPPAAVLRDRLGLTAREAEVALLLARGRSNREVADALTISPHTARHHVQSVLGKLGISSRAAVAHALLRA